MEIEIENLDTDFVTKSEVKKQHDFDLRRMSQYYT